MMSRSEGSGESIRPRRKYNDLVIFRPSAGTSFPTLTPASQGNLTTSSTGRGGKIRLLRTSMTDNGRLGLAGRHLHSVDLAWV